MKIQQLKMRMTFKGSAAKLLSYASRIHKNFEAVRYSSDKSYCLRFDNVKQGPPDSIMGLNVAFKNDKNPNKVIVGMGAYRDDNTQPWVLPTVRKAEQIIIGKKMNKEYAPISGIPEFNKKAIALVLGADAQRIKDKQNATCQAISGTGALRLGANFLNKFWGSKEIWMSDPAYANHNQIFPHAGLTVKKYRYYDPKTVGLDFCAMMEDINKIPENSVILFHGCAHNPTGVDPNPEQWQEISQLCKQKKLLPFIDIAYQGFASGDLDNDACATRIFDRDCHTMLIAQSFAKNMGLYGERVGAFSVLCGSEDEAKRVFSQLEILIRGLYSNPPVHGARIAAEILSNEELFCSWLEDLKTMSSRVKSMRQKLVESLAKAGSTRKWDHITKQIGMFCYTGLTKEQVQRIIKDFSVFLTMDGRISIAGVSTKNVEYLAKAMHEVTK